MINEIWEPLHLIGEGGQGEVFLAKRHPKPLHQTPPTTPTPFQKTSYKFNTPLPTDTYAAIKREPKQNHNLIKELKAYTTLSGSKGIPRIFWYEENVEDTFNILVLEILGPTIKTLRENCRLGMFSVSDTARVGLQLVEILHNIHSKGLVYVDVKPENCLSAFNCPETNTRPQVYLVDMANVCEFKSTDNYDKSRTATAKYVSVNIHYKNAPQPRDDIESLCYLLVELAKGSLPWSYIMSDWSRILQFKEDCSTSEMCKSLPQPFHEFVDYARNLPQQQLPDYDKINGWLKQLEESPETHVPTGIGHTYLDWSYDLDAEREKDLRRSRSTPNRNGRQRNNKKYNTVDSKQNYQITEYRTDLQQQNQHQNQQQQQQPYRQQKKFENQYSPPRSRSTKRTEYASSPKTSYGQQPKASPRNKWNKVSHDDSYSTTTTVPAGWGSATYNPTTQSTTATKVINAGWETSQTDHGVYVEPQIYGETSADPWSKAPQITHWVNPNDTTAYSQVQIGQTASSTWGASPAAEATGWVDQKTNDSKMGTNTYLTPIQTKFGLPLERTNSWPLTGSWTKASPQPTDLNDPWMAPTTPVVSGEKNKSRLDDWLKNNVADLTKVSLDHEGLAVPEWDQRSGSVGTGWSDVDSIGLGESFSNAGDSVKELQSDYAWGGGKDGELKRGRNMNSTLMGHTGWN